MHLSHVGFIGDMFQWDQWPQEELVLATHFTLDWC